jgi:hypothetical protein
MRKGLVHSASATRLGAAGSRGRCTRSGAITLPLFEIASVVVRLDDVARVIVNTNHGIV